MQRTNKITEMNLEESIVNYYKQKANEYSESVAVLSGEYSDLHKNVWSLNESFMQEWERILASRKVKLPVIAFVGDRNSGKSSLVRSLVLNKEVKREISAGYDEQDKTTRLHWIGQERPEGFDNDQEKHVVLDPNEMSALGEPYMLLDSPGMADSDQELNELARSALAAAPFKVMVMEYKKAYKESLKKYMSLAEGSVILPVFKLSSSMTKQFMQKPEEVRSKVSRIVEEFQSYMGDSTFCSGVIVPDWDACEDPEKAEKDTSLDMAEALKIILADFPPDKRTRDKELSASWERYRENLKNKLEPILDTPVKESYQILQEKEGELPKKTIDYLMDKKPQLATLLKMDINKSIINSIPFWAFPFKKVTGLICLTAKAWDRVVLGLGGSLPSFTLAGFTAIRNIKDFSEAQQELRENLEKDINEVVNQELSEPLENFHGSIKKSFNKEYQENTRNIKFGVHGGEDFIDEWNRTINETTERYFPSSTFVWIFALAATLIFAFLFVAPLMHVYGQYVSAAFTSWIGDWSMQNLAYYPTMGFSFWFTVLIISIIPLAILSMCIVHWATREYIIKLCMHDLEKISSIKTKNKESLKIIIKDPELESARKLMKFISNNQ